MQDVAVRDGGVRAEIGYAILAEFSLEVFLDIRDLLANPGVQNDFGKAKERMDLARDDDITHD